MTLDHAIQHMLFKSSNLDIENLAWLAHREPMATIDRYQRAYNWTVEQCEEFFDNITLFYNLVIRGEKCK